MGPTEYIQSILILVSFEWMPQFGFAFLFLYYPSFKLFYLQFYYFFT